MKVETIRWTGSGDGIISGGMEVVFWKKSNRCWEIAWKFKADQPQTLVSATWSIEGPSATAAHPSKERIEGSLISEVSKCVLVCQSNGLSEYSKAKLQHPQPIVMIQWRPTRERLSNRYGRHSIRHVLLTCCLDGTARLWSEIDNGKVRRAGKDINDQKSMGCSYCVVAVIEINQSLKGTLGSDIFVTWGMEIEGIFRTGEGVKQIFSKKGFEHDVRKCDWLVGFGPGMLHSFWAVHCLDDVSPLRFPRVTLWRRHELQNHDIGNVYKFDSSDFKNALLLHKVIILRNCLSGPPFICSPLQLLPCNSLVWSFFHIQTIHDSVENSLDNGNIYNNSSHLSGGVLNLDGHSGKILKVSIHPYTCEVQFAASLDSNGLLLFWSISNISNCILGCPTLVPTWELCGKLATQDSCSMYTSLTWAPSILDDKLVFFMGHTRGIDCFIVNISRTEEENIECHYLCTIPFSGHGPYEDGPSDIFAIPLNSTCSKTFRNNKLMLLAIWMERFQALSWEVNLHSFDMSTSCCECNFDAKSLDECSVWAFESTFASKRYCITVIPCSSEFPSSNDLVTSFAVAEPGTLSHGQQEFDFANDLCTSYPTYIMATGCSDGSLKLWKSNSGNPLTLHLPWELVGMFVAHDGPVRGISFTDCGQKIATFCNRNKSNAVNTIHIWDAVNLITAGTFILEDKLTPESEVITLKWLTLGTGELLLGVCLQNELQVYARKRYDGLTLSNAVNFPKMNIWVRIAFAHTSLRIYDFVWGPRAAAVVIHGNYFSIFSHWLFHMDKKRKINFHPCDSESNGYNCQGEIYEDILSAVFTDCDIGALRELSTGDSRADCYSKQSIKIDIKDNNLSSSLFLAKEQLKSELFTKFGLWNILEVAEIISGSLPTYHPDVLLTNISSGIWKRAYVAVRHLVECLTSNGDPKKRHVSKRNGLPNIILSNYLEGQISKSSQDKGFRWSGDAASLTSISQAPSSLIQFPYQSGSSAENKSITTSTRSELTGFIESLENFPDLSLLINIEKTEILAIIDLLIEVSSSDSSSAYQSLDEPGRRFWVAFRFQQLLFQRKFARAASLEELLVNSRLFVWAHHSDSLENLFGSVIPNEPSWQEMRALGMGFWYANIPQLRARMEKLARAQYLKNRNPKDCALLYIALNRIQVLAGLFKISKDEKDKPLVGFLSRNFQDEKNKAAALKNAYVLLGKHQLELAIAFFMLGGDHSSAINICAKNLGDEQLALVICRLVEGHGGPLEHHLIKKYILPSAIDKGDYWLASLLEWEMGNYYQSFHRMLEFSVNPVAQESTIMSNCGPFLDPTVGFYCQMLATKNSMRNAVGEQNSTILLRWATLMTVTALKRCGNPLEALEHFSSSLSMLGTADQESELGDGHDVLSSTLKPLPRKSSNWLSADVSVHLEFQIKLNLALCYLSKLIREHPSWPDTPTESNGEASYSDEYMMQYEKSVESFKQRLYTGLALFEQRFLLAPSCLISMISILLCHHGLLYIGYDMTDGCTQGEMSQKKSDIFDVFNLYHSLFKPLFKTAEEISSLYSRFFSACSMEYSQRNSALLEKGASTESRSMFSDASQCHSEAWLRRNSEALLLMVRPFLNAHANGRNPYEVDMVNLKKLIPKISQLLAQNSSITNIENLQVSKCAEDKLAADVKHSVPDDERWKILGTCLWQLMSRFMISNLNLVLAKLEDDNLSGSFDRKYACGHSNLINMDSDSIRLPEQIQLVSFSLCDLLMTTVTHISSYHVKQLVEFLWQKLENDSNVMTLEWLKQTNQSESNQIQNLDVWDLMNGKDNYLVHQSLWDHCADPKLISDCFAQEKLNWLKDLDHKPAKGWNDLYVIMTGLHKTDDSHDDECKLGTRSSNHEVGSPVKGMSLSGHASARSNQKDINCMNIAVFQSRKEMYKRNGELLEALCINSTDQQEAAVASNRKGVVFFHLEDGIPFSSESDLLWTKADWPQNGWAGSESTPAPTFLSPGVGLGSKKGAHLSLGGATVGVGSSAWLSRDLTGDGALGILGYTGIGASGFGWEIQQDFEDFVDPPATLENTSTRALCSHPMRPFFLVGSSDTRIYLWEFNKDKATATYGVLPAANVPPPYALASISALQFDHFGHHFASAALDGTVCTWQLEVGGRSNVRPTESSLCFNGHASDVTYFSSSGSIIAVAGYSSNGVNVVIWDTLAPPTTSRASILCHEGGARSLSVFDNHFGSGSVSPLIVTGGKGGDVGVHDFRYIATGKAKRHRRADSIGQSSITSLTSDKDPNVDGILWYIPKAHSGSVTKIVTIPNTSLFLTGSTDGDVKLWDAQSSKLIHHWSKIHEKHTFLQSSARGFGGVVRAGVTDIQIVSDGFLTCGGDGTVKLIYKRQSITSSGTGNSPNFGQQSIAAHEHLMLVNLLLL
ncbi:WD40/YVTN repeat-like-containing domain superfamily [Sesbania bispinosa]|nr:WD40/YVTN repeat-like-containing domain superfamily [Sesbania bispinosa]